MSVRISENEPYVITVDSLELQYIQTNINMSGVAPIWSTQKNYYEFQVVTDSESDNESDSESDNESDRESDNETDLNDVMKCETCNLCDVEVPVIFLDEHYNSDKHKLFQKLTQSVLERAAKSMDTRLSVNKKNISNDIYYCAPCSVAVLKDNKLIHERSNQHLSSQKYHENMSSLIKLYMNRGSANLNLSKYCNEMTNIEEKIVINKVNKKNNAHDTGASINSEIVEGVNKCIEIKLDNGETVKVSRENYHGLQLGNTIICKLCACSVPSTIDRHINSFAHLSKSEKPINGYCLREVDSYLSHCVLCNVIVPLNHCNKHTTEDSVHKMLLKCLGNSENESNVTEHSEISKETYWEPKNVATYSEITKKAYGEPKNVTKHSENSKETFCESKNVAKHSEVSKETYCKPCNRYIHTHNFPAHIKSKKHKSIANADSKPPSMNTANVIHNESSHKINHLSNTSNPKELKCDICKIILPNTNLNMKEHINTKKHKDNLLKWNVTNDKSEMDKLDLMIGLLNDCAAGNGNGIIHTPTVVSREDYCEVCKVKLPNTGKKIHDLGKNHKANLSKLNTLC